MGTIHFTDTLTVRARRGVQRWRRKNHTISRILLGTNFTCDTPLNDYVLTSTASSTFDAAIAVAKTAGLVLKVSVSTEWQIFSCHFSGIIHRHVKPTFF